MTVPARLWTRPVGRMGARWLLIGLLTIFLLAISVTAQLRGAGPVEPTGDPDQLNRQLIAPGDLILVSAENPTLSRVVSDRGANTAVIPPVEDFAAVTAMLDRLIERSGGAATYFVWEGPDRFDLGRNARLRPIRLLFDFRPVPESAERVWTVQPRRDRPAIYRSLRAAAGDRPVLVVLPDADFAPFTTAVRTGPLTWVSDGPWAGARQSEIDRIRAAGGLLAIAAGADARPFSSLTGATPPFRLADTTLQVHDLP